MKMNSVFVVPFSDLSAILLREQQRDFREHTDKFLSSLQFFTEMNLQRLNPSDSLHYQAHALTRRVSASLPGEWFKIKDPFLNNEKNVSSLLYYPIIACNLRKAKQNDWYHRSYMKFTWE